MRWLTQTVAVMALNIRTIPQRLSSSAVAIVGIAGVVVVFLSVLSIAAGFSAAHGQTRSCGCIWIHPAFGASADDSDTACGRAHRSLSPVSAHWSMGKSTRPSTPAARQEP